MMVVMNTLQSIDVPNVQLGSLVALDRLASHPRPGPSFFDVVTSLTFDVLTPGLANLPIHRWACEAPLLMVLETQVTFVAFQDWKPLEKGEVLDADVSKLFGYMIILRDCKNEQVLYFLYIIDFSAFVDDS